MGARRKFWLVFAVLAALQLAAVVGVVSYMLSGEKVQNLNACIPVTRVHRLLEQVRK